MSRIRIVKGKITEVVGGDLRYYSEADIVETATEGYAERSGTRILHAGNPEKYTAKNEVKESEFKLESNYIHAHISNIAAETFPKFNKDNKGIVYKLYKSIVEGKITNPDIIVTKSLHTNKAYYDEEMQKIVIWEGTLLNIEKDNNRKIKLIAWLAEAYGQYVNNFLKNEVNESEDYDTYEYDLFAFDVKGESNAIIAKMESPVYNGDLEISFKDEEKQEKLIQEDINYYRERSKEKGGPNPGSFDGYYSDANAADNNSTSEEGPGDPPFNVGMKFSFSLGGGFSASLYAGISKQIKIGDFGIMPSFNAALTYYGHGTPGTSPMSKNLVTLSGAPAITLGYKTGNSLNMNLFNQFSGSGVNNPYEYAFTLGTIGVLSSGRVSNEYDDQGNRKKDEYNKYDTPHRHQILGGASIKIGNFMISSYNDIYKLPLFLGMDSDQYWSAGLNMQAKITDKIKMSYAFDLYYGKSNNKNPYNLDKIIGGQNYDPQRLFDVLLNRGQETFSFTDANGNINTRTKFGYGTFWPSNNMHNSIKYPSEPKMPQKPRIEDYKDRQKYEKAVEKYNKDYETYEVDIANYNQSVRLKQGIPTFHHLYVVYKEGSKKPDFERLKKYLEAEIPQKEVEDIYKIEIENEDKDDDNTNLK